MNRTTLAWYFAGGVAFGLVPTSWWIGSIVVLTAATFIWNRWLRNSLSSWFRF